MNPFAKYLSAGKLLLLFSLFVQSAFSQNEDLKKELSLAKSDTAKCRVLFQLAETAPEGEWQEYNKQLGTIAETNLKGLSGGPLYALYTKYLALALNNNGVIADQAGDPEKALEFYEKSLALYKKIFDKKGIAETLSNMGLIYRNLGDATKPLDLFKQSLEINEELHNPKGKAIALSNIAEVFLNIGDIPKTLEYLGKSLKCYEEAKENYGVAECLNNMATIYHNQHDLEKAIEYNNKALKLQETSDDPYGLSLSYNNLGLIYYDKKDYARAKEYHYESLKLREEIGDLRITALSYNNLGLVFKAEGNLSEALAIYDKGYKVYEKVGDLQGMTEILDNTGYVYLQKNDVVKAIEVALRSIKIAEKLAYPETIKNAAKLLNTCYRLSGNYKAAYEYAELYVTMRDSVNNEQTRKASYRSQFKYEYETKTATDSILRAKEREVRKETMARQQSEIRARQNQQYFLYGGLTLILLGSGFLMNRFRFTQRQKEVIESQKKIVEEKQREVVDSIHYAKRIQKALMTSEKYIERNLEKLKKG